MTLLLSLANAATFDDGFVTIERIGDEVTVQTNDAEVHFTAGTGSDILEVAVADADDVVFLDEFLIVDKRVYINLSNARVHVWFDGNWESMPSKAKEAELTVLDLPPHVITIEPDYSGVLAEDNWGD